MNGDAYLALAIRVLRTSRRPMSAKEIMAHALVRHYVPKHLHGQTQHKTLTARISEDILKYKEKSQFFRPYPGRYFLSEFLDDTSLPSEYRSRYIAKRRARELKQEYAAYLPTATEIPTKLPLNQISKRDWSTLVRRNEIHYDQRGQPQDHGTPIWVFAAIRRGTEILTYKRGRYLDGREIFPDALTVGFCTPLTYNDRSLFDQKYHGVLSSALRTISTDLDIEYSSSIQRIEDQSDFVGCAVVNGQVLNPLLLVAKIRVPQYFEIETRRLAIRDLEWRPYQDFLRRLYDFDPWSQRAGFLLR